MEIRKRSVLMMSAPALGAFLLGAVLLGGIISTTADKVSESLGATGYVVVSVVRDGNEIYHFEDHNLITIAGRDYIASQLGDSPGAAAQYIALSSNATHTPDEADTALINEITSGGLERVLGEFDHDPGTDHWTISATFEADAQHTGVRLAGLFDAENAGTMVAENTFPSVNLADGDLLTITWTIDLGLDE